MALENTVPLPQQSRSHEGNPGTPMSRGQAPPLPDAGSSVAGSEDRSITSTELRDEVYWIALKKRLLEDPTAWQKLDPACSICLANMELRGVADKHGCFKAELKPSSVQDGESPKLAGVLPCSHILCGGCIQRIVDKELEWCPFCKGSMIHQNCGHVIDPIPLPMNAAELKRFPRTVAEGAKVPGDCNSCLFYSFLSFLHTFSDFTAADRPHVALTEDRESGLFTGVEGTDIDELPALHSIVVLSTERFMKHRGRNAWGGVAPLDGELDDPGDSPCECLPAMARADFRQLIALIWRLTRTV